MKKIVLSLGLPMLLTGICFLNQGCLPVLIGAIAYNSTESHKAYSVYVTDTQKNNTEREIHHLQPLPILSFDDWKKGKATPVCTPQVPTRNCNAPSTAR